MQRRPRSLSYASYKSEGRRFERLWLATRIVDVVGAAGSFVLWSTPNFRRGQHPARLMVIDDGRGVSDRPRRGPPAKQLAASQHSEKSRLLPALCCRCCFLHQTRDSRVEVAEACLRHHYRRSGRW